MNKIDKIIEEIKVQSEFFSEVNEFEKIEQRCEAELKGSEKFLEHLNRILSRESCIVKIDFIPVYAYSWMILFDGGCAGLFWISSCLLLFLYLMHFFTFFLINRQIERIELFRMNIKKHLEIMRNA